MRGTTLRDLQRALFRWWTKQRRPSYSLRWQMEFVLGVERGYWGERYDYDDLPFVVPEVDRLVSKYGPDALLEDVVAEERKKKTSEAHEATTMTSQETHGGDSASGEVPDAESLKGKGRKAARAFAASASRKKRDAHGGVTAVLKKAQLSPTLVTRARKLLAAWITEGREEEEGPRWDNPELAARILTHRNPVHARKQERGQPALLVLADVSSSCAAFSNQTLAIAKAIATLGLANCPIVIVAHSNGDPVEWTLNGKPLPKPKHPHFGKRMAIYQDILVKHDISHIIAFGDHDAVDVYVHLSKLPSVQQLLWLDNHACNYHPPQLDSPNVERGDAKNMRYVTGCKDAEGFLRGMQVALSK